MKGLGLVAPLALALLALSGCAKEKPLPGQRIDVRDSLTVTTTDQPSPVGAFTRDVPIALPAAVNHSAWTHRGGSPTHFIGHSTLAPSLRQIWLADIGAGNNRKARISSDPVVAGGRVFTLDSHSRVMAHSTAGGVLWTRDLTPGSDRTRDASGGGLAYGDGKLFVTTGFGELVALDPASGGTFWTQAFDAPVSGAPTVRGDLVYVSSRDSRAFAVRVADGRLAWELPATPSATATVNGAGPAVTERIAVFPFGSAELVAALRLGGIRTWNATLAGKRLGFAFAGVTDISGDPVVVGDSIYAGSPSGRIARIDINSGERIWTATEGAMSPVVVAGGSVFSVNDIQQLVRIDAATGEVIWKVDLPRFKAKRVRRIRDVYAHYGPILAGGRLVVASDDGGLRSFSPRNGQLLSVAEIPGGAASNPVVVGNTLYVQTGDGKLAAFR